MDTITQGLLGAVTAQLGFRQRIGQDATLVAAATAVVPDLDVFISPILTLSGVETGEFSMMSVHRGISHSLFVVPILAGVVAVIWWWFRRGQAKRRADSVDDRGASPPSFAMLYACVFVSALSHPLLDWCTSYGTQLLLPLTNQRYAIDAVPIVDVIYTPILILTLLSCYVVRKIKRDSRRVTLIIGWVGFVMSVLYLACGYGAGRWARGYARRSLERSSDIGRADVQAYPQLGTIFVWRVTARTGDRWMVERVNVLSAGDPSQLVWTEAKIVDNKWTRQARELPEVRLFDWFARGQLRATYERHDGLHEVRFHDMRYGARPGQLESLWSVRVVFDRWDRVRAIQHVQNYRGAALRQIAREAWRDLWR